MKRVPLIVWIAAASFLVLIVSIVMLFRLNKHGRILFASAESATGAMYFEGEKKVEAHQPFKIRVMIDTDGQAVNAAGLYLRYDPKMLKINEMSTVNSFCQFYPEKKFDNHQGLSALACGSPHPGFKGTGQLVEYTFTPLSIGKTNILVGNKSMLLMSNGKGTNILNEYPLWEVQIGASL